MDDAVRESLGLGADVDQDRPARTNLLEGPTGRHAV